MKTLVERLRLAGKGCGQDYALEAADEIERLQARLDSYCPEEMTPEQVEMDAESKRILYGNLKNLYRRDEPSPSQPGWVCGPCKEFNFPEDAACVHCGEGKRPDSA